MRLMMSLAIVPAGKKWGHESEDRRVVKIVGSHTGQGGDDLITDLPASEISPGCDQDIVWNELLNVLLQPAEQLVVLANGKRLLHHVQQHIQIVYRQIFQGCHRSLNSLAGEPPGGPLGFMANGLYLPHGLMTVRYFMDMSIFMAGIFSSGFDRSR